MGNRCGHNRSSLRLCDVVKRGKGGQAPILGIISAYVGRSALLKGGLKSWHTQNKTGRQRRSEAREAMASVVQFLFAKEFQIDSRRCAKSKGAYHQAVDMELVAKQISISGNWSRDAGLSEARVRSVVRDFQKCGYIKLSKQQKRQLDTGEWISSPKVITFTKEFFLELGGKKLWRKLMKLSKERAALIAAKLACAGSKTIKQYYELGFVVSPRQAVFRPPDVTRQA